ncbi:uncharacterized protein LOC112892649 [Panicum hallii]|uniref:uncharacterized protein LOC112892649 n=1 Tax=Panicum hallii TaxID=206008 RepID=UPI000DF4CE59|nr:uncharacterized protein LOC112892649 [Panicum hallii]
MAAVINEYGTNMFKSKFDPLAAIEAKSAICSGKKQGVNLDTITEESDFKEESLKELDKEKNDNISQKSPEVEIFKETTVLVEEEGESQGVQPKIENPAEKPRGGHQRQSERLKQQGLNHVKTTDKVEALTMKKNLEGLQKDGDKEALEAGAEALKNAALFFHPGDATTPDNGIVLLH